jgi:hypothetical protein
MTLSLDDVFDKLCSKPGGGASDKPNSWCHCNVIRMLIRCCCRGELGRLHITTYLITYISLDLAPIRHVALNWIFGEGECIG